MAELHPYPFKALVRRMFRELEQKQSVFSLPLKKGFFGDATKNCSVRFHGERASSPLGPAAGPHSQMAQNIVLSWLVGGRIIELKTVQILDDLKIPRPCIDMQTVGYNVEWSQELKLPASREEYVKGMMLIELLKASGTLPLVEGFDDTVYDMSVGYDLKGIQSAEVQAFIDGMMDSSETIARLRNEIPDEYRRYRDLPFPSALSKTLTLSTFHGCPPGEIERILQFLLETKRLNCIVKLNPTLLGPKEARFLLHDVLGYREVRIPDTAFERDASWEQAIAFVDRLGTLAQSLGLGFGVKFSNTLIVENHRDFFPKTEKEMYLSGPPLHVLAMNLVKRFRHIFGDRFPISFSAGIDRQNFTDAVALGLTPITVCSDLLQPGGYGRASGYFRDLNARMDALHAPDLDELILKQFGVAEAALVTLDGISTDQRERGLTALKNATSLRAAIDDEYAFQAWVSRAKVLNTERYVDACTRDERYAASQNKKVPKKIGRHLKLFDCISCDKCIPVCPNDANFSFSIPQQTIPMTTVTPILSASNEATTWNVVQRGEMTVEEKHQIGNFADFCNECGNCDVFCPEDGGPYVIKPRFFGSLEAWRDIPTHDGFFLRRQEERVEVYGRFSGIEYQIEIDGDFAMYRGPGFSLRFDLYAPTTTLSGEANGDIDLTYFYLMNELRKAIYRRDAVNYINSGE